MCSMFLPRSSRRTLRPFSVSSLAAHPPEIPEPTTIASYCVDCIRFLVWERERDDLCLPNAPDNLSVDEPPRYLRGPDICIIRCPTRPQANSSALARSSHGTTRGTLALGELLRHHRI